MEVNQTPKQLHKHTIPIVMIIIALLALPVIILSHYNASSLNTETVLARGLMAHVVHVQPVRQTPGSSLRNGLGQTIQLSP